MSGDSRPEGAARHDGDAAADAAVEAVGGAAAQDPDAAARGALGRARAAASAKGLRRSRPGTAGTGRKGHPGAPPGARPYGSGRDPELLASSLDRLIADRGWTQPVSIGGVIGRWRDVVGDHVADHCTPETFTEGALVVRADSTAWAMEVRRLIPQLERRLEEEIGPGVVSTITVLGPGGPSWKRGPRSVPGRGPRDTYG